MTTTPDTTNTEGFDAHGCFRIVLLLPPSHNNLWRVSGRGLWPTPQYRNWIEDASAILQSALGDWEADTEHWWDVNGWVSFPDGRSDGPNVIKPILDLLAGQVVTQEAMTIGVKRLAKGSIIKGPHGLFDDDRRVQIGCWAVAETYAAAGIVLVRARVSDFPPTDRKAEAAAVKQVEQARLAAERAERKASEEAERQRKREEKERLRAERGTLKAKAHIERERERAMRNVR